MVYRRAAEQGNSKAQLNLGYMHREGWGAPQNYIEAYKWFNIAAASGLAAAAAEYGEILARKMSNIQVAEVQRRAREGREILAGKMTGIQVAEAQRLASAWKPMTQTAPRITPNSASQVAESAPVTRQRKLIKESTGSGFAVRGKGHILTNHHVVEGCEEVRLPTGGAVQVIAGDAQSDLALLEGPVTNSKFATFGQGRGVRPGGAPQM